MRRAATLVWLLAGCASPPPPPASAPPAPAAPTVAAPPPLRLLGDAPAAPPGVGTPGSVVESVYEVCLDEHGRVSRVTPAPGLAAVDQAAAEALRKWSWFTDGGRCWHQRLLLGVPSPGQVVRQASATISGHSTRGPAPLLPAWLPALYAGSALDAVYKVCVDDAAMVQSVRPLTGVPGADEALMATLRASRWDVVVGSLAQAPYCFATRTHLDFKQTPPIDVLPPAVPFPATASVAHEPGQSVAVRAQALDHAAPPLSDRLQSELAGRSVAELIVVYNQCVAADGNVAELRAIKPIPGDEPAFLVALRSWRYTVTGPRGVGVCTPLRLVFPIRRK